MCSLHQKIQQRILSLMINIGQGYSNKILDTL